MGFLQCTVWQQWIIIFYNNCCSFWCCTIFRYWTETSVYIRQHSPQPRSVHPAAVWQSIQEYPPPYHQTTEQLLSLRLGDSWTHFQHSAIFYSPFFFKNIFFSCVVILTLQLSAIPKKHQISLYNTKENNFKPVVPTFISKQSSALFGTASRFKSLWIIISSSKDLFLFYKSHSVVLK